MILKVTFHFDLFPARFRPTEWVLTAENSDRQATKRSRRVV